MQKKQNTKKIIKSLLELIKPYIVFVVLIFVISAYINSLNLEVPKVISKGIDTYVRGTYNQDSILNEFSLIVGAILVLTLAQVVLGTFVSERVALDLRNKLSTCSNNIRIFCKEKEALK